MTIKNMLRPAAFALGLLFAASPAFAGSAKNFTVYIVPGSPGGASGSVNAARYSSDSNQFIGCQLYPTSSLGTMQTSCFAKDSANRYISCYSDNWTIAQIAGAINTTSYINFSVTNGVCTYLSIENSSTSLR
jgi:hypothetical protein